MNREHISSAEIVGRLGQKPEVQHTPDGTPFVHLSIATSERFTDRAGEIREKGEWHRAVAWGPLAEQIANTFGKGDSVALSGTMHINSYEKDGVKHRTTELHVEKADKNLDPTLSKNEARLVGVVREDAKGKDLDSGTPMTVLGVATRTLANGKEREDWHSVTLWNKTATAARDIKAGDTIAINGALRHRVVPGEDGQERRLSAIDGRQFQVLERAQERTQDLPQRRSKEIEAPAQAPAGDQTKARGRQRGKGVERDM
jgi:single-stranded DNA-binding protein